MNLKSAILILGFLFVGTSVSFAQDRVVAANFKCVQETGYGRYEGSGSSKALARTEATKQCFDHQLALYEAHNRRLPTDDEADEILNQCVNICP